MIKLGNRLFSPPWWATALFLIVGTVMLLLGRWQLQRAAEKISLATAATQALSAAPLELKELLAATGNQALTVISVQRNADEKSAASAEAAAKASINYKRVTVTGTLLVKRQFLWDNRVHKGQAGFEVIVPVQLTGTDSVVLLNRGWVPVGASRDKLPDVSLNDAAAISIEGLLTEPSRGFAGGPALVVNDSTSDTDDSWPKLLQYFDYHAISGSLGSPVVAGLVQNIAEDAVSANSLPPADFLKTNNWQAVANGPEKHYGYAFQWFGMFIALLVIFWVTNSRKVKSAVVDGL